jgi:hypothetical protein
VPRRIEVPSADALFGRPPSTSPPRRTAAAKPRRAAAGSRREVGEGLELPSPKRRSRRAAAPAGADQGVLRRLDQLEAVLADLPVDRLIELREALEVLLASDTVDAADLHRLLEVAAQG